MIEEIFRKAIKNHQENNIEVAQNYYYQVLEINPEHLDSLNNLGVISQKLKESRKAKNYYKQIIEIDPNYEKAYFNYGVLSKELGEYQEAISYYEKAIDINSNYADAYNNLGTTFKELGQHIKALNCYEKAIEINPNFKSPLYNLAHLFQIFDFDNQIKKNKNKYKKIILLLLRLNNINLKGIFYNAKSALLTDIDNNQISKIINSDSNLLSNKIIQNLLKENILHLILQKSLITNIFFEKLLTKIRHEILFTLNNSNKNILNEYFDFIVSLAEQCWLNEYIFVQSISEIDHINKLKKKIETDTKIDELEILILSFYIPLNKSKIITNKLMNYKSANILFNNLIDVQIKDSIKETELAKSIPSLEIINDSVSRKVQEQYEENPYPRWKNINSSSTKFFLDHINEEIMPNKIIGNNKLINPNILIAGCGTGLHSIAATRYKDANILAVDLSLKSLAYAKRKTMELSYENIQYLHADILQLNKLNRMFDVIESIGTLHHMKDPGAGLRKLLDVLKPDGFLKLGLYSELARGNVIKARKLIDKKNFKNTINDIKTLRNEIINEKEDLLLQTLTTSPDFYTTSSIRDLLFHVKEHRFTIPEISKTLKDSNLEFLGFCSLDPLIKKSFLKLFPKDKKNISLDNWHKFETNNPKTFYGMYNFWVRKL
tara:strand:- start:319 stop:2301 length:1983 start_codon:yes stop_codon:yes gene_type:complete